MHRIVHQELFDDLTASVISNEEAVFKFDGQEVVDAKFIDDKDIMIIFKAQGLIKPYRSCLC